MLKRTLGRTGIQVSEIGFGAWGIGGWGERDDEEAVRALQRAFDLGITFYDTAYAYGDGHSEQLIGKALQGRRDQVVIASKVPPKTFRWPVLPTEPLAETFPKDWIIHCTERSLKNLNIECLDVQQLHSWTPAYLQQDEWYAALTRLKEQGKIRAFGISANDWEPYETVDLVKSGKVDTIQVIYNIFEQRPAEKLLPAALENKVGIIVRVPFEEGLLTGKMRPGYQFGAGDWRAEWLSEDRLAEVAQRTDALTPFLAPDRPTLSALALKFCLSHPAVSTVIPGMRKVRNLEENVKVSDGKLLSAAELEALRAHAFVHGWAYPWAQAAN